MKKYQSIELARKKKEEDKPGSRVRHLASDSGPRGTFGRKPEATQSNGMRTAHRLGMRPIYDFFLDFFFYRFVFLRKTVFFPQKSAHKTRKFAETRKNSTLCTHIRRSLSSCTSSSSCVMSAAVCLCCWFSWAITFILSSRSRRLCTYTARSASRNALLCLKNWGATECVQISEFYHKVCFKWTMRDIKSAVSQEFL